MKRSVLFFMLVTCFFGTTCIGQTKAPRFKVLVLAENGGHHVLFTKGVKPWLDQLAVDSSFVVDYFENAKSFDEETLNQYRLFIQLDYPPYGWPEKAVTAFQKYIEEGRGGWIGFHHATLLGEFDGFPMWNWFSIFMGDIRYNNYIATFVSGKVNVEDSQHPVMKGVPSSFVIDKEEWYTYNRSPRPNVHVIASVDESTYKPETKIKMGDHPVIWTNEHFKARNLYIFMGHTPDLLKNPAYTALFRNAIFWASK